MSKIVKHIGRSAGTGQRLSVVFLRLPDEPDNALVVYSDALPDRYHDEFMAAVESPEGQSSRELYEVLSRKVFFHGKPMLDTLHSEGKLVKVPTSTVIMTPTTNMDMPLDDLLSQMDSIDGGNQKEPIVANDTSKVDPGQPIKDNVDMSLGDDAKMIAQNLLQQAVLLEQDALRKRAEAVQYDPSLAEKAEKPAKKGRGRPKGTTKAAMAAKAEASAE